MYTIWIRCPRLRVERRVRDSRPVQSVKPKWALAGVVVLTLFAPVLSIRTAFASSDAKKQGQELFATKGCAHCHGPNGVGGGKGPDLQLVRTRRSRESMIMQIHDGGQQMPSFGDELSAQEIEDLVAFLRAKRKVIVVAPKHPETQAQSTGNSASTGN